MTPEIDFGSPAVRMSDIKEVKDKSFFSKTSDFGIMDQPSPNFEEVPVVIGEPLPNTWARAQAARWQRNKPRMFSGPSFGDDQENWCLNI